jgi:hypothetical protein
VIVANKSHHKPTSNDVYVARPSILGNPFSFQPGTQEQFRVANRDEAIQKYEVWLEKAITDPQDQFHEAVTVAMRMLKEESVLVCWCKPKKCHADVIISLWRKYFKQ